MAARQGGSRSANTRRIMSPTLRKEERSLSVRFTEPDKFVRRGSSKTSAIARGHMLLLPNKGTRPKTCGPSVPYVPKILVSDLSENTVVVQRPATSGNKMRRPSMTRSSPNFGPNRADTPTPETAAKGADFGGEQADDSRSEARRALHLPQMRDRSRSVPNVQVQLQVQVQVPILEDSSAGLEEASIAQNSLSPGGNRSVQRRGSINISTDRLLRDLSHGIQHAELQEEEPEKRWTEKQQVEWDKLKACRYLRFSKRYENELEKEVDPFS